jgi:hypothetical protein
MNYSSLHITTNFHIIKKWVEERGGKPARIRTNVSELTGLRIFYPQIAEPGLEQITWNQFFDVFAEDNLAFMYQANVDEHNQSTFYKLVRREDYVDELVQEEKEEDGMLDHTLWFLNM